MDTEEIFGMNSRNADAVNQPLVADKHKNLFDELEKAENVNKHRILSSEESMDVDRVNRESNKRKRSETKHFRGKESIFKRPEEPLSKCLPVRQLPGFKRNPNKWTKYSLDSVRVEDTSEKGNTAAALSFLRELEERKISQTDDICDDISVKKPVFHATAIIPDDNFDKIEEKVCFKGSKIVMPEYVVGQKKKSTKKHMSQKSDLKKGSEVKLEHLLEVEDE